MSTPHLPDPAGDLRRLLDEGRFRDLLAAHASLEPASLRERPEVELVAATAATRVGELEQAAALAGDATAQFRLRGDVDGEARAVNLIGAIDFERGALTEAQRSFVDALSLARRIADTRLEARAANNLASVMMLRGVPATALGLYRDALSAYQRLGDRRGAAETHHNLGLVYRLLGMQREAAAAIEQAVRHAEFAAAPDLMALALMGRAELELERGDLDLAEHTLACAAALCEAADDAIGAAEVVRLQSRTTLRRGDADAALALALGALEVATTFGAALLIGESRAAAALAARAAGHDAEAAAHREAAIVQFQRLGATLFQERFDAEWLGT